MFSRGEWDPVAKTGILAASPVRRKTIRIYFAFFFPPVMSIPFSFDMLFLSFLDR